MGESPRFACGRCDSQSEKQQFETCQRKNIDRTLNPLNHFLSIDTKVQKDKSQISQTFCSFEMTPSRVLSMNEVKGYHAKRVSPLFANSITEPLDTNSWMFEHWRKDVFKEDKCPSQKKTEVCMLKVWKCSHFYLVYLVGSRQSSNSLEFQHTAFRFFSV